MVWHLPEILAVASPAAYMDVWRMTESSAVGGSVANAVAVGIGPGTSLRT